MSNHTYKSVKEIFIYYILCIHHFASLIIYSLVKLFGILPKYFLYGIFLVIYIEIHELVYSPLSKY